MDWEDTPGNLTAPLAVISVKSNKRYRFRLVLDIMRYKFRIFYRTIIQWWVITIAPKYCLTLTLHRPSLKWMEITFSSCRRLNQIYAGQRVLICSAC